MSIFVFSPLVFFFLDSENHSDCNLYEGNWIFDDTQPFYVGNKCKWLAPNWACRLGKNSTFEYEKYRWKPKACDPPRFSEEDFLKR